MKKHLSVFSPNLRFVSAFGISSAIADENRKAMLGAVMEALAYHSYKIVRPAYYEVMLTTRNVHDVESSEMLDIIFATRTYDMAIYFGELGFSGIFANAVYSSGDNFNSKYAAVSKNFNGNIGRLLNGTEARFGSKKGKGNE